MIPEPFQNEAERLEDLDAYQILQTPPEEQFEESVRLAAQLCDVPISGMTLVSAQRQWFKALFGQMARDLPRNESFCIHTLHEPELLEVEDAHKDPRFVGSPLVTSHPHIRFYAGAPLRSKRGLPLGALCVIDQKPRKLTAFQRRALATVAAQVSEHLELRLAMLQLLEKQKIDRDRLEALERKERERAAVTSLLVHDMKSPLTALLATGEYLSMGPRVPPHAMASVAREIIDAGETLHRLVSDLLDTEHADAGRLKLHRLEVEVDLLARRVVSALTRIATRRGQRIELVNALGSTIVSVDPHLFGRLLTNLVENALKYGPRDSEVRVELSEEAPDVVTLRVVDRGTVIPEEERELIFEPYHRLQRHDTIRASQGLGLAFCKRVAHLHGGSIRVEPAAGGGNAFVLRLPRNAPASKE